MLILHTHLIGLPIVSLDEKKRLGNIDGILVDRNNAKVIGLIIQIGPKLFGRKLFLSETDVLEIDRHGVVTRSEENLIDPAEIVKAKKILAERFRLIKLRAVTKSGQNLGRISDYVIDSTSMQIMKFYIHGLLADKIFGLADVEKITKKEIIFKNNITTDNQSIKSERIMNINKI